MSQEHLNSIVQSPHRRCRGLHAAAPLCLSTPSPTAAARMHSQPLSSRNALSVLLSGSSGEMLRLPAKHEAVNSPGQVQMSHFVTVFFST